jgi:hypothetical protein
MRAYELVFEYKEREGGKVKGSICWKSLVGPSVLFYVDNIVFAFRENRGSLARGLINQLKTRYKLTGGNKLQLFLNRQ